MCLKLQLLTYASLSFSSLMGICSTSSGILSQVQSVQSSIIMLYQKKKEKSSISSISYLPTHADFTLRGIRGGIISLQLFQSILLLIKFHEKNIIKRLHSWMLTDVCMYVCICVFYYWFPFLLFYPFLFFVACFKNRI